MTRITIEEFCSSAVLFEKFVVDLKAGAVVAIPTDTLYGFAADADSINGVEAIYRIKQREKRKPLILFIDKIERMGKLGIDLKGKIRGFLQKHWPGALTGVFPCRPGLFKAFCENSIGIRIPNLPSLLKVLEKYPGFLLTTSANFSGEPPIFDPDEIQKTFQGKISWLLDGGKIPLSEPSTIADMATWPPKIIRAGKVRL